MPLFRCHHRYFSFESFHVLSVIPGDLEALSQLPSPCRSRSFLISILYDYRNIRCIFFGGVFKLAIRGKRKASPLTAATHGPPKSKNLQTLRCDPLRL